VGGAAELPYRQRASVVAGGNEKHLQLREKEGEVSRGPISNERDRGVELTEGGDSWWRRR
jgi:hypothetical protein